MDPLHNAIAENLKRLRKERKLSLDRVAEMTEVSKSMLSQIRAGRIQPHPFPLCGRSPPDCTSPLPR